MAGFIHRYLILLEESLKDGSLHATNVTILILHVTNYILLIIHQHYCPLSFYFIPTIGRNNLVFSQNMILPYLCTKKQGYGSFFLYTPVLRRHLLHLPVAGVAHPHVRRPRQSLRLSAGANILQRQRTHAHLSNRVLHPPVPRQRL